VSTRRSKTRTQKCSEDDARSRVANARKQLDIAELAGSDRDDRQSLSAATSAAVLAGIAAADAACCKALGERSRSQDHRDGIKLIRQISPGGSDAANDLQRLLAIKDEAQYGFRGVTATQFDRTFRRAKALVDFAGEVLQRG
jgi:hypothetical protein